MHYSFRLRYASLRSLVNATCKKLPIAITGDTLSASEPISFIHHEQRCKKRAKPDDGLFGRIEFQ